VVLHQGAIVHEYYPGAFAGPRTRMQLFSVSKSVTSLLVGIALTEGAIGSVKDEVHRLPSRLRRHGVRAPPPSTNCSP